MGELLTLDLDYKLVGDETYNLRNPLHPAQPLRVYDEAALTAEDKKNKHIVHRAQKENSLAFMQDLEDLRTEIEEKVRSLSVKYSKTESFIGDHIFNISSFKPQRKTNLFNAEVAMRARELREMGQEGGLKQAQADVQASRAQRNGMPLPPERQAEILSQAEQHRLLKDLGSRKTNLSAAKDTNNTVSRIESELKKLNKRTGASAILVVTRGHLNDSITPTAFETSNASGFCQKVLGCALPDMAAKLESWNVMANQGRAFHGSKDLRKKCVGAIHEGLRDITGKDDIAMNYQNYDTSIVARYKIHIIGWPSHVPFTNPSCLKTDQLQRLADALDSQECRWRVMSGEEITAHNIQFNVATASGKTMGKARKERSDKNKKRTGSGDVSSVKKRRVAHAKQSISRQLPPQAISKEFINDSDDEWEEGEMSFPA